MNDYERMARVIRHLDESFHQQSSLEDLAAAAGLSPSHFQRLFSKLTGVTPKDFVQCLTAEHAKQMLREGASVLDAGLSGPGRLHDLCVTLEAASPGEVKNGGHGLTIRYGFGPTPFGECLLAQRVRGIYALSFVDPAQRRLAEERLQAEWPGARLSRSDPAAHTVLQEILTSQLTALRPLRAFVKGSKFQIRVWRALLRIPPGSAVSYGRLAAAIGNPAASRAVGTAVGANPLAYLIPCHRVIRQTGALGHYRWGLGRKRAPLGQESAARGGSLLDAPCSRP
ncbi:MAG: methylated-DNA--[protein]-cysteine S-methyltransferase [Roseibacillus sp.]